MICRDRFAAICVTPFGAAVNFIHTVVLAFELFIYFLSELIMNS